jgi:hypothetical protein
VGGGVVGRDGKDDEGSRWHRLDHPKIVLDVL